MIEIMLLVGITALIFCAFLALYLWARRSESSIDYEHPGLTDERANTLRLGIALAANAKNSQ
jgi:nitrogen fixation-related uncharacterized protein